MEKSEVGRQSEGACTGARFPRTIREWIEQLNGNGATVHPAIQFLKYGFIGGLSSGVNVLVFMLVAWFFFPCFKPDDPILRLLGLVPPAGPSDAVVLARYAVYANLAGFFVSDVVCYFLNRRFVFLPGRMNIALEFLSFTAVSGLAIAVGSGVLYLMVAWLGIATSYGFLTNVVASALFYYILRKFVIFQG